MGSDQGAVKHQIVVVPVLGEVVEDALPHFAPDRREKRLCSVFHLP